MRKLATIRKIDSISPIENADAIECVTIGGWKLVSKKGEFKPNDLCVYFEIDSVLPSTDPRYGFLTFKDVKTDDGLVTNGHRLKTVKLRGQVSQGLALPLSSFPEITNPKDEDDVTELLTIKKYDDTVSSGGNRGNGNGGGASKFPSWLKKSDQERCQNLVKFIFEDLDKKYEVTQKLDGSSGTFFYRNKELGLCSRNLKLRTPPEFIKLPLVTRLVNKIKSWFKKTYYTPKFNSNWHTAQDKYQIFDKLNKLGKNIAIQGEVISPTIQKNYEKVKELEFRVYNIFDIDTFTFLTPDKAKGVLDELNQGSDNKVLYVPVVHESISLRELNISNIEELLAYAVGESLLNPEQKNREGFVFKSLDDDFSFKVISNQYLLKQKD